MTYLWPFVLTPTIKMCSLLTEIQKVENLCSPSGDTTSLELNMGVQPLSVEKTTKSRGHESFDPLSFLHQTSTLNPPTSHHVDQATPASTSYGHMPLDAEMNEIQETGDWPSQAVLTKCGEDLVPFEDTPMELSDFKKRESEDPVRADERHGKRPCPRQVSCGPVVPTKARSSPPLVGQDEDVLKQAMLVDSITLLVGAESSSEVVSPSTLSSMICVEDVADPSHTQSLSFYMSSDKTNQSVPLMLRFFKKGKSGQSHAYASRLINDRVKEKKLNILIL